MMLLAGAAGYVILFLTILGLFKLELKMPMLVSVVFAVSTVTFGLMITIAGTVAGLGTLPEVSGYSAAALFVIALVGTLINEGASPA